MGVKGRSALSQQSAKGRAMAIQKYGPMDCVQKSLVSLDWTIMLKKMASAVPSSMRCSGVAPAIFLRMVIKSVTSVRVRRTSPTMPWS